MIHPMLEKYAKVLVNYCLEIKKGDTFLIQGNMLSEPLIKAVYKEAVTNGAHPLVLVNFEGQNNIFFNYASEEQLSYESPFMRYLYENVDAVLNILGSYNTKALSNVDPEKIKKRNLAATELREIFNERAAAGELKWNICQYPTLADAQEARHVPGGI